MTSSSLARLVIGEPGLGVPEFPGVPGVERGAGDGEPGDVRVGP